MRMHPPRRRSLLRGVALLPLLALDACGFHLRGQASLPFDSLFVEAPENSTFGSQLRRYLSSASRTRLTVRREDAQAILQVLGETQEKVILSLSGGGRVREYQLRYKVRFRLRDQQNRDWMAPGEILLTREYTYDDQLLLAKESEEILLYKDMRQDAVQQMMRRLTLAKTPA